MTDEARWGRLWGVVVEAITEKSFIPGRFQACDVLDAVPDGWAKIDGRWVEIERDAWGFWYRKEGGK